MSDHSDTQSPPTALITGASSGIGREFARLFARDRCGLVLVARSQDKLRELGQELENRDGVKVLTVTADLALDESPAAVFRSVTDAGIQVDALINSAGFGGAGSFLDTDLENEMEMIGVNVRALTQLTKLFLPGMVDRGTGHIVNVASTASFFPGPNQAVYYATKAYVLSFTQSLAHELKGTGVSVTALCPGKTHTNFHERAGLTHSRLAAKSIMKSAAEVARCGYQAMQSGRLVAIPGFKNKLFVAASRFIPRRYAAAAVEKFQKAARGDK